MLIIIWWLTELMDEIIILRDGKVRLINYQSITFERSVLAAASYSISFDRISTYRSVIRTDVAREM